MSTRLITLFALIAFTTTSDARPGAACSKLCRKTASCRLIPYDLCMDMCGDQRADETPEKSASTLAQSRLSCRALAQQTASSDWLCTAEGATTAGYASGTKDTRGIYMLGTGPTRSAAVYKALRDCGAIMTMQLGIEETTSDSDTLGAWEVEASSRCHITQCIAPTSTRKSRSR